MTFKGSLGGGCERSLSMFEDRDANLDFFFSD